MTVKTREKKIYIYGGKCALSDTCPVLACGSLKCESLKPFSNQGWSRGGNWAMSLSDLSFPISELTWDHYWVVQEELGLSETETDSVLTQVLGPNPYDEAESRLHYWFVLIAVQY